MADGIANFLTPGELHKLGRLTLLSRYVVEGNLAGAHKSPQKGSSSEFADHRAYFPGDDPKHIDWKVLGRTDRYFIRRYEDETNLRVYLIVDRSGSMGYGSEKTTKYDYACRLAAAIGYVVVKARDSVGLFLHSDKIDVRMDGGNSFLHLNNLLKRVQSTPCGSQTDLPKVMHQVAEDIRKRALVVVISDLFGTPEEVALAFAHFRKLRHDVIVFHVLDPMEIDLGFRKGAQFVDMETQETINVDPRSLAPSYQRVFAEFLEQYRNACASMNVDYRMVRTDQPVDTFVRAYLEERRRLSR
ncbi:MAG: hypothetical protein A2498_03140 [Lentisphaerae bacterium RIFOXYC12_FULL_60_16]|nr:MAG: hypothetical protein A2498_03140 [Lentisphaerae bacterium RIFOXYC12_FULL_60_16]OGV85259.1 MAG: hypothetical protein A2340_01625 [Lentisphaerae bacterium RIFOXYB12_FULL_60_10]